MLDAPDKTETAAGAPAAPAAPSAPAELFEGPLPGWKPPEPALPPVSPLLDAAAKSAVLAEARSIAATPEAKSVAPPAAPAIVKGRLKGIAILGSQPDTVMQAPFHDEGFRIYVCSPDNTPYGHEQNRRTLPRFDEWFELHAPIEDQSRPYGYLNYVAQLPVVWMRDIRALRTGLFKGGRAYPDRELYGTHAMTKRIVRAPNGLMREVEVPIPAGDGRFCPYMFTSSLAYMMAKAIVDCEREGIPQIGLWGIQQRAEGEYAYQRPGTRYFLWEAMKAGIKVRVDPLSQMFDAPDQKW